jgi:DNA-directed RNA polymerase subunit RPC12/RpoP
MIFSNPSGAPELACDQCGCRWFDRMANVCYECGAPVTPENISEIEAALAAFAAGPRAPLDAVSTIINTTVKNP